MIQDGAGLTDEQMKIKEKSDSNKLQSSNREKRGEEADSSSGGKSSGVGDLIGDSIE